MGICNREYRLERKIYWLEKKIDTLKEALQEAVSLLRGEKKFAEDLTIWGPGGHNVVRINEVIAKCEKAIGNADKAKESEVFKCQIM